METTKITCPHCKKNQEVFIPENNSCLAMHKCQHCGEIISSKNLCCVVCEYSQDKCPASIKTGATT